MNLKKIVLIIIGMALVLGGVMLWTKRESSELSDSPGLVFCTQDAMQCPDGSWVGRTGPNCEFVCPGE